MSRRPVVWAVVHDLDRSGVPIALLRLVRWQTGIGAADVHIVAGRDGALRPEFRTTASVTTVEPATGRSPAGQVRAALAEAGAARAAEATRSRWIRHRVRHLPAPDVVLVQGAGAWPTFAALEPAVGPARVVVHLHELEVAFGRSGLGSDDRRIVERADRVLVVSEPVAALARRQGADRRFVETVPGSVDDPPAGWDAPLAPATGSEVLSMGSAEWRKGTDLASAAAHELARRPEPIRWHWVGAPEATPWRFAVGSADPLIRHGASAAPWQVVDHPAALVVPSREDPLPLVALEAGARGIPVIATRCGGLTDLLADGRGVLVDPLDIDGLAHAVADAVDDPVAAQGRAEALRAVVRRDHATEVVGPRWLAAVLDRT